MTEFKFWLLLLYILYVIYTILQYNTIQLKFKCYLIICKIWQNIRKWWINDNKLKIILKIKKKDELRRIPVPPHRMAPLRKNWEKIVTTVVENMKMQIRMNTKKKCVELKVFYILYNNRILNILKKKRPFKKLLIF